MDTQGKNSLIQDLMVIEDITDRNEFNNINFNDIEFIILSSLVDVANSGKSEYTIELDKILIDLNNEEIDKFYNELIDKINIINSNIKFNREGNLVNIKW